MTRAEICRKNFTKHGHCVNKTSSRTYNSWFTMIQRCTYPKSNRYAFYGAKGITVCSRWLYSFEAFLEDMGERPLGMSLDRFDNSGNYELLNCRWATPKQQARNNSGNFKKGQIPWNKKCH